LLNRVDIVHAFFTNSKPYYQAELDSLDLSSDWGDIEALENPTDAQYQTKLLNLTGLQDLTHKTIKAYGFLRHLMTEKERVAGLQSLGIAASDHPSLQLYGFRLIHRLLFLIQYESPDPSNPHTHIYSLFGNAGIAHIIMFICNGNPRSGDSILMSKRIQTSLEMINLPSFQIAYPEMMLWVVMMGGLASIGGPGAGDTKWFIKLLADMCRAAGIATKAQLSLFLEKFLWSEFYLVCPLYREFWDGFMDAITEGINK
jgi:hypothetical protein